jgi:hypothetical protein
VEALNISLVLAGMQGREEDEALFRAELNALEAGVAGAEDIPTARLQRASVLAAQVPQLVDDDPEAARQALAEAKALFESAEAFCPVQQTGGLELMLGVVEILLNVAAGLSPVELEARCEALKTRIRARLAAGAPAMAELLCGQVDTFKAGLAAAMADEAGETE